MRTTVRLDHDLLRQTRALAARTGRTLTSVIEDALRETLARHRDRRRQARPRLPTFTGKGLRPGVDLDDTAGLLDLMEGGRRGAEWVTTDRDYSRFPGLRWRDPGA